MYIYTLVYDIIRLLLYLRVCMLAFFHKCMYAVRTGDGILLRRGALDYTARWQPPPPTPPSLGCPLPANE